MVDGLLCRLLPFIEMFAVSLRLIAKAIEHLLCISFYAVPYSALFPRRKQGLVSAVRALGKALVELPSRFSSSDLHKFVQVKKTTSARAVLFELCLQCAVPAVSLDIQTGRNTLNKIPPFSNSMLQSAVHPWLQALPRACSLWADSSQISPAQHGGQWNTHSTLLEISHVELYRSFVFFKHFYKHT